MKIELTNEDIDILGDLVFLGHWLVNAYRLPDAPVLKYKTIADKFERLHGLILSCEEKKLFDKDSADFYFNKLNDYINEYEDENCFSALARKLAEANYPENPNATQYYGSFCMQADALEIYEKELKEKGTSIIKIDIPDMDDRLETCRQAFNKMQNE